jgi:hypothetical protein
VSYLSIPDPKELTWARWSSELALQNPLIPMQMDEIHWTKFADELLLIPELQSLNVPQPTTFRNWRDWARRLHSATLSLS